MKVEVNGNEIATTDTGFLTNIEDWTEDVAKCHRTTRRHRAYSETLMRSII